MSLPKFTRLKFNWPSFNIDLRKPAHRLRLALVLLGLLVVGGAVLIGGVHGYLYSESPAFCGTVCHSMEPQYVRYQASPHAHVACAECHVGPGFSAFVNSKIEGTRQLIDTLSSNYDRPIKSPVINLRPARETCETCHTPTSFKDNIIKIIQHYDNDVQNTPVETTFILKMGGLNQLTGESKGIHWHTKSEISYIALDDQRQTIAWVGVKQADGSMKQYFSRDLIGMGQTSFVDRARQAGQIRKMDCIDCHNRVAHYIPYPEEAVDQAISNGLVSRDLPYIRMKAVGLLSASYNSQSDAISAIEQLGSYYTIVGSSPENISQAVTEIKKLYNDTNFPGMNLNWKTNPNNQQHTPTLGCFRCHDNNHIYIDDQGAQHAISAQCNLCHTVPIVGRGAQTLVETPVIVGDPPVSHQDFRWTIDHRNVTDAEKQQCYNCHGQAFCNNAVCHNLSHPADMLVTHPQHYQAQGGQVCYTCHQNVFCSRCHAEGVINNP